ncbi:MAG: FAD binding domain-containing protein [Rhodospirillales bacterium]|nr:MAG: FAD binding domain-containing protein [Rhodospirillales bacterium]
MGRYLRPDTLAEATAALADAAAARRALLPLAGGTDFYPARVGRALDDDVLDLTAVRGLRGVEMRGDRWRIGATTTWRDILDTDLPPLFDGLRAAAREVGGAQIQNAATIAGNLCNASPAADGVPCLLALDAEVELTGADGARALPLSAFIAGNRRTARRDEEIVTAILVPGAPASARGGFLKLGARRYLVISIAMVAATLEDDGAGRVARARVAVGACSEIARRLPALEAALVGRAMDAALGDVVAPGHLAPLAPIDDVRGSAAYRADVAATLVRRLLSMLGGAHGSA